MNDFCLILSAYYCMLLTLVSTNALLTSAVSRKIINSQRILGSTPKGSLIAVTVDFRKLGQGVWRNMEHLGTGCQKW